MALESVMAGLRCVLVCVGVVYSRANRGECGGAVIEGPCERCTRVSDEDGDKSHLPPILLEALTREE